MSRLMTVRFARDPQRRICVVTAYLPGRRPIPVSTMAATARIPHDLATFVIEDALGIADGFFNLTAHGATFRSSRRRFTRPGRALIAAHRAGLDAAEHRVHEAQDGWRAGAGGPVARALAEAERQWAALAPCGYLERPWRVLPLPGRVRSGGRGGRRASVVPP